ncbi:MAG: GGDEF domain-containing protein [Ilumatobacteraceae bacterium]
MAEDGGEARNGRALRRQGVASRLTGARSMMGLRALVLLLGSGTLSALSHGDQPMRIGAGILGVLCVVSTALWARWYAERSAPYVLVAADVIGAGALGIVEPRLWAPAVAIIAAALVQGAVYLPRVQLLRVCVGAGIVATAVTALGGWQELLPGAAGLVAAGSIGAATVYGVVQHNRAERIRMHTLLDGVEAVVWELDRHTQQFTYVSGWAEQFGLTPERWLEYPNAWLEFVHPDDRPKVNPQALIDCADRGFSLEIRAGKPPQYDRVFRVSPTLVGLGHPSERAVRGVMVDISDLRKSESLIRHQARHDALTNLANRAAVVGQLSQELATRTPRVALLLLDLDRFKEVNDALGHHRGDYLLQQVAKRLTTCLPSHCFVGRLGATAPVVVVLLHGDDPTPRNAPRRSSGRALRAGAQRWAWPMQIGVSIGIVVAPHHGDEQDQLFRRADMTSCTSLSVPAAGWAMWWPEFEEESARCSTSRLPCARRSSTGRSRCPTSPGSR